MSGNLSFHNKPDEDGIIPGKKQKFCTEESCAFLAECFFRVIDPERRRKNDRTELEQRAKSLNLEHTLSKALDFKEDCDKVSSENKKLLETNINLNSELDVKIVENNSLLKLVEDLRLEIAFFENESLKSQSQWTSDAFDDHKETELIANLEALKALDDVNSTLNSSDSESQNSEMEDEIKRQKKIVQDLREEIVTLTKQNCDLVRELVARDRELVLAEEAISEVQSELDTQKEECLGHFKNGETQISLHPQQEFQTRDFIAEEEEFEQDLEIHQNIPSGYEDNGGARRKTKPRDHQSKEKRAKDVETELQESKCLIEQLQSDFSTLNRRHSNFVEEYESLKEDLRYFVQKSHDEEEEGGGDAKNFPISNNYSEDSLNYAESISLPELSEIKGCETLQNGRGKRSNSCEIAKDSTTKSRGSNDVDNSTIRGDHSGSAKEALRPRVLLQKAN